MDKQIELKPCPFCGHRANKIEMRLHEIIHKAKFQALVGCDICTAVVYGFGMTDKEAWDNAIEAWNRRVNNG